MEKKVKRIYYTYKTESFLCTPETHVMEIIYFSKSTPHAKKWVYIIHTQGKKN